MVSEPFALSPIATLPAMAPVAPTTTALGRLLFWIETVSFAIGTPFDQLPALNQSDETAPVQELSARTGATSTPVSRPARAVVPRRRAPPAFQKTGLAPDD